MQECNKMNNEILLNLLERIYAIGACEEAMMKIEESQLFPFSLRRAGMIINMRPILWNLRW